MNDQLRIDASDLDLPPIVIPEADVDGHEVAEPLLDSWWPFGEQCQALIGSKPYGERRGLIGWRLVEEVLDSCPGPKYRKCRILIAAPPTRPEQAAMAWLRNARAPG